MSRYLRNHAKTIRQPVHEYEREIRMIQVTEEMRQKGLPVTTYAIAKSMGLTTGTIDTLQQKRASVGSIASLDVTAFKDESNSAPISELVIDESASRESFQQLQWSELQSLVEEILLDLPKRTQTMIQMRHGFDPYLKEYTLEEIGKKYGLSRECVRQILSKAYLKLRQRGPLMR